MERILRTGDGSADSLERVRVSGEMRRFWRALKGARSPDHGIGRPEHGGAPTAVVFGSTPDVWRRISLRRDGSRPLKRSEVVEVLSLASHPPDGPIGIRVEVYSTPDRRVVIGASARETEEHGRSIHHAAEIATVGAYRDFVRSFSDALRRLASDSGRSARDCPSLHPNTVAPSLSRIGPALL